MIIWSDYNTGALTDEEYKNLLAWENAKDECDKAQEEEE